jgi:hypothetical protein
LYGSLPIAANSHAATDTQKSYMALKQPPFRPPPQAFGPVWTILYGLMGYAAHRAYSTGMHPLSSTEQHLLTKQGATLYTIQLGYVHSRIICMEAVDKDHVFTSPVMSINEILTHETIQVEPPLDAALLRRQASHRSHC